MSVMPTKQAYIKDRMTDDQQAQVSPVTEPQGSPMPSEEQKAPESLVDSEVDHAGVSSQETTEEGLPVEAKERTRQEFEKLRNQLREERARREYLEQVNSTLTKQPEPEPMALVDPDTGFINEQALTDVQRRSLEAERRAQDAERRINEYLDYQEKREVFTKHPDLNPGNEKFDKNLSTVTSSLLFQSMVKPDEFGGKQLSFMEAAELAKSMVGKAAGKSAEVEDTMPKEQASLEATGSSGRRTQVESDLSDLQYRTRKGDKNAIVERLKRLDAQ